MGADRINHRGLLPDEEMARAMEHQAALLFRRLGRHEPDVGSGDRLADRLGVGGIVLLPLDVGLHVGRRHQPHGMADRLELARPVVRRCAGSYTNEARRQLLEERQDIGALQLAADDHLARRIDAMDLKYRLRDVETNCRDRLHACLLPIVVTPSAATSRALTSPRRSRPQHHEQTFGWRQMTTLPIASGPWT